MGREFTKEVGAEVLALLEAAGAPVASLQLIMGAGDTWHPGRSATLGLGKNVLAAFGDLHPRVAKTLDLPAGTVAAEIYLDSDIEIIPDAVRTEPNFMTLFAEYNKYLLRRVSVWLDI